MYMYMPLTTGLQHCKNKDGHSPPICLAFIITRWWTLQIAGCAWSIVLSAATCNVLSYINIMQLLNHCGSYKNTGSRSTLSSSSPPMKNSYDIVYTLLCIHVDKSALSGFHLLWKIVMIMHELYMLCQHTKWTTEISIHACMQWRCTNLSSLYQHCLGLAATWWLYWLSI